MLQHYTKNPDRTVIIATNKPIMSVNLNKHKDSLVAAWKDVLNDKTATNWALFGYEGQTNDLKVISAGCQGIEELTEDLNSGKIMYAFAKIDDLKSTFPKYVLINWQGEGANTVRKGMCANHLRDIEKLFSGAQLTVNARNEEEVDPDLLKNKLFKSTSSYNFKIQKSNTEDLPISKPTNNKSSINTQIKINLKERDEFWLKEEEEEKKRLAEEFNRKKLEKMKQKEIEEVAKQSDERNETKVPTSDLLRQQRKQEANELIGQRTIDAKSVFEKNTSAGQIKQVPQKPVRSSLVKAHAPPIFDNKEHKLGNNGTALNPVLQKAQEEHQSDEEVDQFATIKRSPRDVEKKNEVQPSEVVREPTLKYIQSNTEESPTLRDKCNTSEHLQNITDQQFVDEVIYQEFSDGSGLQARALYDYQAADDTEITFDPGDIITNIDQVDEGWWQGLSPDGTYGLFPANYVELMQ